MTMAEKFQIQVFFDHYDQGFSHFESRRVKSERRYSQRATLKRRLSFLHVPSLTFSWNSVKAYRLMLIV